MSKFRFISTAALMLHIIVFVSCNGVKKNNTDTKEVEIIPEDIVEMRRDQIALADIETGVIELHSLGATLKASGIVAVAPQSLATVCVPMGGFIRETELVPGSVVIKGQTLAVIENQEYIELQQKYLESTSQLEYIEAEYKRQKDLFNGNVSAPKTFQQITAEYKSLKAQVKGLAQKLALIGINSANLHEDDISRSIALVSPIAGYVKTVNANIGKFVSPTDVLFEIINNDKLLLELTLFEKDAEKISGYEKIRFFINNESEQHEATVYQTSKSVNIDKTYKVYASIEGVCKNILPGMYVNAFIEASTKKVTALPSEAIVSFDDKDYIFIFDKNKDENGRAFTEYRMVEVQIGISDGGYTEIHLPEGFNIKAAKVVIKGAYNLLFAKKNAGAMSC